MAHGLVLKIMALFWDTYFYHVVKAPWILCKESRSVGEAKAVSVIDTVSVPEAGSGVGSEAKSSGMSSDSLLTRAAAKKDLGLVLKDTVSNKSLKAIQCDHPFLFLTGQPQGDPEIEMMVRKMGQAIGLSDQTLFNHWGHGPYRSSQLKKLTASQRVLIFGAENFHGLSKKAMGVWFALGTDWPQVMYTHSLRDLKVNAKLKRQTWAHLQSFASEEAGS